MAKQVGKFTKLKITQTGPLNKNEIYFFGGSHLVCSDSEQHWRVEDSGFEVLLPKPVWSEENPSRLYGLLRISGNDSLPVHYTIDQALE